jgi:plastocyanin
MQGIPSSADMAALMGSLSKGSLDLPRPTNAGYQTPLVPAGGTNSLSPLVPQQLAQTLSIATSSMNDLKLWPMLAKVQAQNTVVEYNRVLKHGGQHSPFISEGGNGILNRSTYEKVATKIRYMAERREVTDQASMVSIVGPSADAIAEETRRGTESLLQRLELNLFHADESKDSNAFNGIIKQIKDGGNVADLRGKAPSAVYLSEILGHLYSAPLYGMVTHIMVTPRVLSELIKQTVHHGRHDQIQVNSGAVTFGAASLTITGPYGPVQVVSAPFLERHDRIAPALGESSVYEGTLAAPTEQVATAANANAASKFVAADAGDYVYRVVAVGSNGVSAPVDTTAVTVAAGDQVTFTIRHADHVNVKYLRVYRSAKDAANADGALLIDEVAVSAQDTVITDNNENIPGTSEILFLNFAPDYMCYYQMLSLVRRPLAQISTTFPFLLMMFGAPAVKLPTKMYCVRNVGINASSGLENISDASLLGLHI